jgi:release factor glutamine methyltransferase
MSYVCRMTIHEATYFILNQLRKLYPEGEASQITDWLMEHITGSKKVERMVYKNDDINEKGETQLKEYLTRLLQHEPIQYILNEAWFGGMKFYVDQNVLIPRPETEELVDWVITDCKFPIRQLTLLDIGCGSGCISIFLKRKLRKADVWACDISEAALNVAKKNAANLGADIHFLQLNFLNEEERNKLPSSDIIVSNPPYVPEKDKLQMQPNVLQFEPASALFVPDNDALIFYKAIADFGKQKLNPNGAIYVEIHEDLGESLTQLFQSKGYSTELKKDMQGKDRMIKAINR